MYSHFSRFRPALLSLALCAGVFAALPARAQAFPERPIRVVNLYSPGGPADSALRIVAQHMSETLGQPVVIENKPGAGGSIAAGFVAQQPADGYTLLLGSGQISWNALLYKKLPYKMEDFAPVSLIMKSVNAMIVPATLPVTNVREFVEYAKRRPGELNYAILGQGGSPHINGKMLERAGGIRMVEVSYRGASEATQDVLAGRMQAMFVVTSGALAALSGGKARILGVTGAERLDSAPNLPTFREQGFDVVSYSWFGLLAPAGTPQDRIDRLHAAVAKAVQSAKYQDTVKAGGNIPVTTTPAEMATFIKTDYQAWEAVVKPMNLQQQ